MVDFKSLEAFIWIAQLGGFRAAAEKMHTTQPAVSQRIALLEQELGFVLLERGPRGAVPTARGQTVLTYAQRLIDLRAEMLRSVTEPESMHGTVRLGVSETLVHTWLGRLIERLHATYPRITLDIEVDLTLRLRNALVGNQLDLAFLLGPISEPRIANAPLSHYPIAFIARPDLALPKPPIPLQALAEWPIITYQRQTRPYIAVRDLFAKASIGPPRIFGNSSLSTIVRMTLDGIGISLIPPVVVRRELAEQSLRILEVETCIPPLEFTVAWPISPANYLAETVARLAQEVAREIDPALDQYPGETMLPADGTARPMRATPNLARQPANGRKTMP